MHRRSTTRCIRIAPLVILAGLAGCAADQPYYGSAPSRYPTAVQSYQLGQVERIEVIRKGSSSNVAGTLIGGIVGGLIGAQIGGGSGRTAATIAGAAGGAIAGNAIEGRRRTDNEAFRVGVRLDDGSYRAIVTEDLHDLRTGDRVRVDGDRIVRI